MQQNRTNLALGILLILIGAGLVIFRQFPIVQDWIGEFSWPMWLIAAGLMFLVLGLLTGNPGMAVPACFFAGVGGIFLYQSRTGDFASWAYLWTLIPGFVGVGTILEGLLGANTRKNLAHGLNLIAISAVLFLVFATFFGGLSILGDYGVAILLILLGIYVLIRGFVRSGVERRGHSETR
jgi:hypothetical protein